MSNYTPKIGQSRRNKLLGTYNAEIENVNRTITSEETESVIRNHSQEKFPNSFTGEFYQTFKEEFIPSTFQLFQKRKKDLRALRSPFC